MNLHVKITDCKIVANQDFQRKDKKKLRRGNIILHWPSGQAGWKGQSLGYKGFYSSELCKTHAQKTYCFSQPVLVSLRYYHMLLTKE